MMSRHLMYLSPITLKQHRENKGWTQDLLAHTTGLSLRTIQRIESNGRASAESVLAISSALEVLPSDLQSSDSTIHVNWKRGIIMSGVITLTLIIVLIISLFNLASDVVHYIDGPTIIFFCSFLVLITILGHGIDGIKRSLTGLKFMFASDILGGTAAKRLVNLYSNQITYSYASATLVFLIGLIAVIQQISNQFETESLLLILENLIPVLVIPYLYALIVSECILRPLKHKLISHSE